jgi:hypothetical protein
MDAQMASKAFELVQIGGLKTERCNVRGAQRLEPQHWFNRIKARRGAVGKIPRRAWIGRYAAGALGIQKSENRLFWRC